MKNLVLFVYLICHVDFVRMIIIIGNSLGDEGAKYIINFLNGKSNVQLAVLLLNRKFFVMLIIHRE